MPEIRTSPRSRLWPDRRRKPLLGTVEVDWGHPISRALAGLVLFNEGAGGPYDLVHCCRSTPTGAIPWTTDEIGLAADLSSNYFVLTKPPTAAELTPNTTGLTAMWGGTLRTDGGGNGAICVQGSGCGWTVKWISDTTLRLTKIAVVDTSITVSAGNGNASRSMWALTDDRSGSNNLVAYRNGVSIGTLTETSDYAAGTSIQTRIGASNDGVTIGGHMDFWAFWLRPLLPTEIAALAAGPYAFLRPKVARRYSIPAAAGGAPQLIPVGQVTETDLAQAIARVKSRAVGQVAETDLAQVIARLKQRGLGQASEADVAQTIARLKRLGLGQPSETDLAQALSRLKLRSLVQTSETDLSQPTGKVKRLAIGQAEEFDLALKITATGGAAGGPTGAGSGILRTIRG